MLTHLIRFGVASLLLSLAAVNPVSGQITLFQEDFSGSSGAAGSLNGSTEDFAGETWTANGFATTNGQLNVGQFEGSAVLPFEAATDRVYNLSLDVTTVSSRWIGLGFSEGGSSGVLDRAQDRFAQSPSNGIAWLIYRPGIGSLAQQVQIFGGLNTNNVIADNNANFSGALTTRTLEVVLDTTADLSGDSFQANFLIDGESVSGGFQTINLNISEINFVGFTFEGPNGGANPPITVDNFLFTVTEPVSEHTFSDVTAAKNLADFRGYSGDLHGSGGVFTDLNNDGYPDLYLTSNDGATDYSKLYLNVADGSGGRTFSLQTDGQGDDALGAVNDTNSLGGDAVIQEIYEGATGAVAADYDNDGDVDLYVTNMSGTNRLYQNQLIESGTLGFVDVTSAAGVSGINTLPRADGRNNNSDDSLAAAWFDPDRDGDLDLYVGNHNDLSDNFPFDGATDTFYLNNGDGTFTEATALHNLGGYEERDGDTNNFADTNAVVSGDLNNDGWVDLLVTNKSGVFNADQIYINQGADSNGNWLGYESVTFNGNFENSFAREDDGASLITRSAMGANLGDVDGDGDLDIYISDNPESNFSGNIGSSNLFINQFVETGTLSFLHGQVDTGLSWGVQMEDFDNDGDLEIHSTNDIGANSGNAALLEFVGDNPLRVKTALDEGNPLFQGNENNPIPVGALIANVEDVSDAAGTGNAGGNGRASLAADYNRDGKLDLFLVNLNNDIREGLDNQQPVLLENTTPLTNSFLSVKLVGNPANPNDLGFATSRDAIGSRVIVVADVDGDGVDETLIREVISGSSNATSTSSLELEFGLGEATDAQVNVIWADGRTTDLGSVTVNEFIVVEQTGPTEPLTVEFAIDGDNDVQRSMVRSLDLAFSASVNLGEDAFELVRRGVDGGLVDVTATVDDSGANVVLTFSGTFAEASGSLVDGNYQLTINGSEITNGAGNPFDLDGDGKPGGSLVFGGVESDAFYRLFGDINQSRLVDVFDLLGFRQAFLFVTGDASFNDGFDSNDDGVINVFDLLRFRQNFLKSLPFDGSSNLTKGVQSGAKPGTLSKPATLSEPVKPATLSNPVTLSAPTTLGNSVTLKPGTLSEPGTFSKAK